MKGNYGLEWATPKGLPFGMVQNNLAECSALSLCHMLLPLAFVVSKLYSIGIEFSTG